MNNSLVDLLHCQWHTQNDTIHMLQAIQQSQRDYPNDSLTNDIPCFAVVMVNLNYIFIVF